MQAQARAEDLRFATERRLICKGSARVRFECLKWNEYIKRNPEKLKPDPKHVKRIKQILKRPGCRPMEVGHHILAVVDQQQLDAALEDARQKNRWNMDTLPSHCAAINTPDGYPELEFPAGIECLRGRHRIEAAKDLPEIEKWWIVDLYLSTISYEHKTFLIEKYPSGKRPRDGEIYRKIRDYQILSSSVDSMISPATCVSLEKIWWSLFSSENRRDKLDNFLSENKSLHGDFRDKKFGLKARFDSIMKIPGLFDDGMMVTVLHKITAMGCPEVSMLSGGRIRSTHMLVHRN
jgi:hypothetical protein